MAFCELHAHTMYSNLKAGRDSTNRVSNLIDIVHSMGHKGLAITEHDTLTSSLEALNYIQKKKYEDFRLVLGNEIYLCPNDVDKDNPASVYPHFILNALDLDGYTQIRRISTRAWERAFMRNVMRTPTHYSDLEDIIGKSPGHVVGSSACIGSALNIHLLMARDRGDPDIYDQCIEWVKYIDSIFGHGYFFLEMQPSPHPDQIYINRQLVKLSRKLDIPLIITNDIHYYRPEDRAIHKAFLQSQQTEREVDEFYLTTYAKTEPEMHEYLDNIIGKDVVEEAFNNTMKIRNMTTEYDLHKPLQIPYMCVDKAEPDEELLQRYADKIPSLKILDVSVYASDRHLCQEIMARIEADKQYQNSETYAEVETELQTLIEASEQMNVRWSAYLLTEQRNVELIWESGNIVGCGRGSGVGFLLLNILGITQVNPLRESSKTYYWRFLNPARAKTSVLDIDIDIPQAGREAVIQKFREAYGDTHVAQVLTVGTEKSKSAILTACRGLGVNNDYAQYLASMIVSDRGALRSLSQMYYGDPDNDMLPDKMFVNEMNLHPEIWETALKIEGLVKTSGVHAGGVIITDKPFEESTSLMRTNSGTWVTSYTLHDLEEVSLIKFDVLSIALDKIQTTLELLLQDRLIEWQGTLKDTYEKYIGIYNLERDALDMWKLAWDHKVLSLFQMEKDSGKQAIALVHPTSVDDLAIINSVMRLMPADKNSERPLEKLARFKNDITEWYKEMDAYGLTEDEQELLKGHVGDSYGILESQEGAMMLVQVPEIGGFDLLWADGLRKAVAKKNPASYLEFEKQFFENAKEKKLSKNLTDYVWKVLISVQRGYSFNRSHTLSYSLIALQELNLCYRYPMVYWNTANLIVDSGSLETDGNTDYGRMATAIGLMWKEGVYVTKPYINLAEASFKPDAENSRIIFGLQGIKGINGEIAAEIIKKRPYESFEDFLEKHKDSRLITASKIVQLIKAGCFDEMGDTCDTMIKFVSTLYNPITKLGLSQMNAIMQYGMLSDGDELYLNQRMIKYKQYVLDDAHCVRKVVIPDKKVPKAGYHDRIFKLDGSSQAFFKDHFSEASIVDCDGNYYLISEKAFVKELEKTYLDPLKDWLARPETAEAYNACMLKELMNKHGAGSVEHWHMEALSYYPDRHELSAYDLTPYGVVDYFTQPEEPESYDYYVRWVKIDNNKKEQKAFPKYKIDRIAGTVINTDNNRHVVVLMTPTGVVNCKLQGGAFSYYNRTISEIGVKGKKAIVEYPWFKRGTTLLVAGYRTGDQWRVHNYSDSIYKHTVAKILGCNDDGTLIVQHERAQMQEGNSNE